MGGWGGVAGEIRDKAIPTQVVVEVEVELGNDSLDSQQDSQDSHQESRIL